MPKRFSVRRLRYVIALLPAIVMILAAVLIDTQQNDKRRVGLLSDHARLAAEAIDVRLEKLIELAGFCASSPDLIAWLDIEAVRQNCGRYASQIGAWVVITRLGDTHRQILNTRADAPDALPEYPRTKERPELLALEAQSKQTGKVLLTNVFNGIVYPQGVIAAGQFLILANGQPAMLYISIPAASVTRQLVKLAADGPLIFGLIDPSRRIIARSAGINQYMFTPAPGWMSDILHAGGTGASLAVPGPVEIGGVWDAGYHPLSVTPGWMAVAVSPTTTSVASWTILSVPSALALFGFCLSTLSLWLIFDRDRVAARIRAAERAQAEAERKKQEKSRLLSSVAHDIRSPLISLMGSLEGIEETESGVSDKIRAARCSAEALLQMIDDILELSFLGSGGFTLHPSPVDLRKLAQDLIDQTRGLATRKGLALWVDLHETFPLAVEVDRLRLQQVLSNLLTNAVKYTETGKVTLRIRAEQSKQGKAQITFSVIDTGIGLNPADYPKILKEFGRLDRETEQREQGVGLGLAIVQRILRSMGSELNVESMPGEGATFSFRLDLPIVAEDFIPDETRSLSGLTIIYAEDEAVIRQVTARRLSAAGATIIAAENGADALDKLATLTPDLLLLDLQMPVLDGVSVIRKLRAQNRNLPFPVFILTSHISAPRAAEARLAGVDAIFTKPIQIPPLAAAFHVRNGSRKPTAPATRSPQVSTDAPLINIENFTDMMDVGDRTYAIAALARFEDMLRKDSAGLRLAAATGDILEAAHLAHRCLGACQIMGAQSLSKRFRSMEDANDLGAIKELLVGLADTVEATLTEMRTALAQHFDTAGNAMPSAAG